MFLLIYFAVIIILGLLFVISRNNKNDANGIPGLSLAQMIYLSVTSTSSSDFTQEIIKLHEKYGPIFKIHIKPFNPIIFTRNAEYIEKIFMSKDHLEKSFVYHIFEPFLGNGIASVRSMNEWKIDRKLVNCAMGQSFLTQLLSKTDSYINEFCDNVKNRHLHQPIDIQSHIHNVLLKVILETISNSSISLDWDMVSRYDEARARFYELSIERMLSIYLFPDTLHKFSNNYTDTQKVCKVLTAFANNLLRQHKLIQEPATNNHNLIQMLIDSGMSDDKIVSNINTIIEGGHDTSALTTTWMAYELSRNKVVQENILKEAIDVLGIDAQREITLKDVQEMKYIECFVSEVLRRYTILNILIRKVGKSVHINNNEVPEGSILVCIPHAIHTSKEYYDDPTVFDPDRFLPENNGKLNPYAYIPFSVGPRNCIGGWKIMKNWNLADHDGMSLLINLQVKYGVSPYFKISVDPHPNGPGSGIVKISPSGLGLPDKSYYFNRDNNDAMEKAYVQFISDVVINFSATKEEADRFGRDLYSYEKRIAEITPDSALFQDPIQTYNLRTIRELSETVPQLFIADIVAKMYPEATIDLSTEVIVTSPEYLAEVARIITTTDKATINSYYIWTLVREYLPYLNAKFAASWTAFNNEILGISKPPERWEFCINLVQKFMGLAVEVLLDRKNPITNNTRRTVNDVYESIRHTVTKRLTKYKTKLNLHKHLITKINTLQLEIGLPPNISTDEYVKNFYKKLNIIKKSFFDNYKNSMSFLKKIEERRLTMNVVDDYLISYIYSKPTYVHYSPSENKIVIPNILLSNFYFEDKYPWPVIFGRLGVEIAEAIVSSILPYDNVWTAEHRLLTQFHSTVNESISVVKAPQSCLQSFILKYHLVEEIIANLTTLNVVKTISALQITEEALNDFIATKEHIHQPSFEAMEDSGLFYLTYSQTLCSITADQYKLYNSIRNYKFPHKALLFSLWFQVPGFSSAFSCSANTIAQCSDIF